jgi:chorismate-pyruvate lyase|tara:strand:- start:338 stop:931 length:594 start_codon:yes stop_codon:yes gene_type:complete
VFHGSLPVIDGDKLVSSSPSATMNSLTDPSGTPDWLMHPEAFDAHIIAAEDVPDLYQSWAFLDTSMTVAVNDRLGENAKVVVHHANTLALQDFEIDLLRSDLGFARQISLQVNNECVLAARSIVCPGSELQILLSRDNKEPLGKLLFTDSRWQRLSDPIPLAVTDGLIGRYCCWQDANTSDTLLVEEFFLPALIRSH